MFNKKPSRKELLTVIGELQDIVSTAKNAFHNDRAPDRVNQVVRPLERGFELCLNALAFDPPLTASRSQAQNTRKDNNNIL